MAKQQLASRSDAAGQQKMKDIIEALLKAGANDNLQRLTRISVTRNGMGQDMPVFSKGTNSYNRPTLYEMLATHYCPPSYRPGDVPSGGNPYPQAFDNVPGLKFPDFSKIMISRLEKDGQTSSIKVDLESALNSGGSSSAPLEWHDTTVGRGTRDWREDAKDINLEWGDIVEIPEAVHNINETWDGLTDAVSGTLKKCLERKVSIVVKGTTNQVTLRPNHYVLRGRYTGSSSGLTFEYLGGSGRNLIRPSKRCCHPSGSTMWCTART
jgi:hypothetical protein